MTIYIVGLSLKGIRGGSFKDFAEKTLYGDLAKTVELNEETRNIRTIHKAKATEFESVMVILDTEDELDILLDTTVDSEEKRLKYVALSRARDNLFLLVPSISIDRRSRLEGLGITVIPK